MLLHVGISWTLVVRVHAAPPKTTDKEGHLTSWENYRSNRHGPGSGAKGVGQADWRVLPELYP